MIDGGGRWEVIYYKQEYEKLLRKNKRLIDENKKLKSELNSLKYETTRTSENGKKDIIRKFLLTNNPEVLIHFMTEGLL